VPVFRSTATACVLAALLLVPAVAAGATFAPATPISGVGDEPALAQVSGAALTAAGASAAAGSAELGVLQVGAEGPGATLDSGA